MYHSVTIGDKNTYEDWHLVPDGLPIISMPSVKTNTVEVPGRDGVLDLSEVLTKYPVYQNRQGSLSFHVLKDYKPWQVLYQEIANYVHGRRLKIQLEDDPSWYYNGRITLNSFTDNKDGTWHHIEFGYDLDPYKLYSYTSLTNDWLWDPFNFYNGVISGSSYKQLSVTSTAWTTINLKNEIGRMPLVPNFIVVSNGGIDVHAYNSELGINITKTNLRTGTHTFPEIILSNFDNNENVYIRYKKTSSSAANGTISIEFRKGSL